MGPEDLSRDPNPVPNSDGVTPLLAAARMSVYGPRPPGTSGTDFTQIVVSLLRAGADASPMYAEGFWLAFTDGGIVRVLLQHVPLFVHREDLFVMVSMNQ